MTTSRYDLRRRSEQSVNYTDPCSEKSITKLANTNPKVKRSAKNTTRSIEKNRRSILSKKCSHCNKSFHSIGSMNNHYKRKHNSPLICQACHCQYSTPASLNAHQYEHGQRPFHCSKCGKDFPFKSRLDDHFLVHVKKKKLKCSFVRCNVKYKSKSQLMKHERTHSKIVH